MNETRRIIVPVVLDLAVPSASGIEVFSLRLEADDSVLNLLRKRLSRSELHRADTYASAIDRNRFIIRRAVLREQLSLRCGLPMHRIVFQYSEFGKPYLASPDTSLVFNCSHSGNIAIIAISRKVDCLGVDVEQIRFLADMEDAMETVFSYEEIQKINRVSTDRKPEMFFTLWTRKEAYLKALGSGLSTPPKTCRISVSEARHPTILKPVPGDSRQWELRHIHFEKIYVGTLVFPSSS
ncbi:4'-phosphopantetheinyl transferase superfamily protein [bacterium]|nr:4'-phosphopantetheinyl transferase superfamily protein [candidate division CSSED10-310 bacterium]